MPKKASETTKMPFYRFAFLSKVRVTFWLLTPTAIIIFQQLLFLVVTEGNSADTSRRIFEFGKHWRKFSQKIPL